MEEEVIQGDCLARNNPLHWDIIQQNLPCMTNDFLTYDDDIRLTGGDKQQYVQVMRKVGMKSIELFETAGCCSKPRPPMTGQPGAWAEKLYKVV
eukprot:7758595-Ditylum_brightwellii.AAC.1